MSKTTSDHCMVCGGVLEGNVEEVQTPGGFNRIIHLKCFSLWLHYRTGRKPQSSISESSSDSKVRGPKQAKANRDRAKGKR